jgi:hypothetical protein
MAWSAHLEEAAEQPLRPPDPDARRPRRRALFDLHPFFRASGRLKRLLKNPSGGLPNAVSAVMKARELWGGAQQTGS